jgi:hypothetical protein
MTTIVTRAGKGDVLTHAEVDANFTNLNNDKVEPPQGIFYPGNRVVTADFTIGATENYMSPGPVEIADGVTVTIEPGGEWVVV